MKLVIMIICWIDFNEFWNITLSIFIFFPHSCLSYKNSENWFHLENGTKVIRCIVVWMDWKTVDIIWQGGYQAYMRKMEENNYPHSFDVVDPNDVQAKVEEIDHK